MERHKILTIYEGAEKLVGIRRAWDEVIADAVKRQQAALRIVGDLLKARSARSRPAPSNAR